MGMDDDPDPEMQTGTLGHPISISSGSPFQGSPYRGPDSFQEKMATYDWYFTPSYHSSPAQPPLDEPQLQAVSPPPLPVEEPPQQPPQPPPEPPRQRRNARSSGYNPFENTSGYPSDYGNQDPYLTAAQYHHLYPSSYPLVYPTGYPVQDYQYPPYQQPPPPQQLQQQQQTQEILERLDRVEQKARKTKEKHNSFMKGLANLIKGKKK
ncbi:vacuolar protein sorting-associated protein 27-like [Helianthus annuus]|uniref:vacuolar protein sorting-associated protein 27-like n=1 Tax=Helianthus annuus TaxID=4232 RepID=UPI000B8FF133|nr:vacuolar protein sorting-associated protein 27-like [Helianthus annuus]